MAKEGKSSGLTPKLVLAFACILSLLLSLPSSLNMYAVGQNSNSTDSSGSSPSSDSSNNSQSQPSDTSPSSEKQTGNTNNATSSDTNSTSTVDQNTNSTSATTENTENQQSQNTTSTEATAVEAIMENSTAQIVPLVTISGEPLVKAEDKIKRSFSYPLMTFMSQRDAELTVELVWDLEGKVRVSDNRGYAYSIVIPESQGNFSLWYNSNVVDQRVTGPRLNYDVYWMADGERDGLVKKYKYTIAGTSLDNSTISFNIQSGSDKEVTKDKFVATQPLSIAGSSSEDPSKDWTPKSSESIDLALNEENTSDSDGLVLDWSDALSSGHYTRFNSALSNLEISVNGSFLIDPTIIGTTSQIISPTSDFSSEGEVRMITGGNNVTDTIINVFYYDGSNIVYRTSNDKGKTWSSPISTGTGVLASDSYRWTAVKLTAKGNSLETS